MKIEFSLIFGLVFLSFFQQIDVALCQDYRNSVITDPGISRRCHLMIQKRDEKIKSKQKMRALINRSRRLLEAAPKNKEKARGKLRTVLFRLRHEYNLSLSKIKRLEEDVVRQGCPGIQLE